MAHPNIIETCAVWYDESPKGNYYLVSEFLCGGDLFECIQKTGPMQVTSVRFYTSELLAGVAYLHDVVGYMHRDLKPENIMLTSEGDFGDLDSGGATKCLHLTHLYLGHLKIIDLGSIAAIDGSDGVAEASPFCGTAKYLSPEILEGKVQKESMPCLMFASYPNL